MTTQVNRWESIEHVLVAFGQAMYLTVDELTRAMVWMNGRAYAFSIHTLHLRPDDSRRYHITHDSISP